LAWYFESPPKSPAGSPKTRKSGKDGEDGVTLSKIQLFDNGVAGIGEEKNKSYEAGKIRWGQLG
jgi:hypothetical protein